MTFCIHVHVQIVHAKSKDTPGLASQHSILEPVLCVSLRACPSLYIVSNQHLNIF